MVSVITIFLNGDRSRAKAIESALVQTYEGWELLLVDNESTDRAGDIAKEFADRFPKIIGYLEHIGHAHRGMSASRNLGVRHARGEFIPCLDVDDAWRLDATQGETWRIVRGQLRVRRRSFLRRLSGEFRHQAQRVKRRVNRTLKKTRYAFFPPPVILCYHRVFEPETDPYLLAVSPRNLREQLEVILRIARPLSLDQLSDSFSNRERLHRGIVLTFDDGYIDNLKNALPLLQEFGVPAAIYVATGYVGTDREFWWDDLERLILGPGDLPKILRLEINGRGREWDLGDDARYSTQKSSCNRFWNVLSAENRNPRQSLFADLHAALRPLPETFQQQVLQQLHDLTGAPQKARPFYRCMTASELKTLAAEPLITIGAHTVTHCDLDYRTKEEQQNEIAGSKQQLEKVIGRSVEHFSYPYGSFNEQSVAVCSENSFRSAVTCTEEPVGPSAQLHRLPRFLVRNRGGAEFEQQLKRYFRG